MAGKHRRGSRIGSSVARLGAPGGIAAAAVGATSVSTALMTGTTTSVAPSMDLLALITPANSTAQVIAGSTYYGTDYTEEGYGPQQVVFFFFGPQGIADEIRQSDSDPEDDESDDIAVLASGWGAGQTGEALRLLAANDDPALADTDLVILDNNTNRAGGGFWTTYDIFAPLLFTSAQPTPNDLDVTVWDVGYKYNINGNAVTYPANVISLGNSLAAYVYGYGGEQNATLPTHMPPGYHFVVDPATGRVISSEDLNDPVKYPDRETPVTTTYVTFESGTWEDDTFVPDGPPLLRPLKLIPGGDIIADTLGPAVQVIVDAGYKDNQPIPTDPTVTRPMGLLPVAETTTMLNRLPGAVRQGLEDGAETAQEDFENPGNFVTKTLAEFGKLPGISSLPTSNNTFTTNGASKFSPDAKKVGTSSSTDRPRPLKKIADNIRSSLNRLSQKDEPPENKEP